MIGPEHEQPHEGTGDFEDAVLIELSDLERGAFGLVRLARIPGVRYVHPVRQFKLVLDRAVVVHKIVDAWNQIGLDHAGLGV